VTEEGFKVRSQTLNELLFLEKPLSVLTTPIPDSDIYV